MDKATGLTVLFAGIAVLGTGCSAAPGDAPAAEATGNTAEALVNYTGLDSTTFDQLMHGGAYMSGGSGSGGWVSGAGCTDSSTRIDYDTNGQPTGYYWKWVQHCSNAAFGRQICDQNTASQNTIVRCTDSYVAFYYDPLCPSHNCLVLGSPQ